MPDLVQTPANVRAPNKNPVGYTAGEAVLAGDSVRVDSANVLFKASTLDADTSRAVGIAVTNADLDDNVYVARNGDDIEIGAALTIGEVYGLSPNAGKIRPTSDNVAGDFVTILGIAVSATILRLSINNSGVAHA